MKNVVKNTYFISICTRLSNMVLRVENLWCICTKDCVGTRMNTRVFCRTYIRIHGCKEHVYLYTRICLYTYRNLCIFVMNSIASKYKYDCHKYRGIYMHAGIHHVYKRMQQCTYVHAYIPSYLCTYAIYVCVSELLVALV